MADGRPVRTLDLLYHHSSRIAAAAYARRGHGNRRACHSTPPAAGPSRSQRRHQTNFVSTEEDPIDDEFDAKPSKSARKRQMHALQALGKRVSELSGARQAKLPLTEPLRDALALYARIRPGAHEARRRQMQLIGKLMRHEDDQAIEAALDADRERGRGDVLRLQQATQWRDDLVQGTQEWADFLARFPQAPDLSALIASARQERSQGRPPRDQRQLYRRIEKFLSEQ
ncbi:MAG: ribosome biogenesis factor YjgA [Burkholderiaceae bacterium]